MFSPFHCSLVLFLCHSSVSVPLPTSLPFLPFLLSVLMFSYSSPLIFILTFVNVHFSHACWELTLRISGVTSTFPQDFYSQVSMTKSTKEKTWNIHCCFSIPASLLSFHCISSPCSLLVLTRVFGFDCVWMRTWLAWVKNSCHSRWYWCTFQFHWTDWHVTLKHSYHHLSTLKHLSIWLRAAAFWWKRNVDTVW